jgi:hypothetical protein
LIAFFPDFARLGLFGGNPSSEQLIGTVFQGRAQPIIASGLYTSQGSESTSSQEQLVQLATDFYW